MNFPSKHSPCVGIRTCSDYSPFGVELDGRTVSGGYRYGFQNQEKDDEVSGVGNIYTAEFWQYSPRIGRRINIDPKLRIWLSAYHSYSNNPVSKVDRLGALDDDYRIDRQGNLEFVRKTNDNYNTITGLGRNDREMTITISKGIIENAQKNIEFTLQKSLLNDNNNFELANCQYSIDLYKGSEDELKSTFIFFSNVTEVEWSLYSAGEESIIATSHDPSTEVSWQIVKNNESFLKSSFNQFDHNHPAGSTSPSGLSNDNKRGDMALISSMKKTFSDRILKFNIYTINEGFTEYNENTKQKASTVSKKMERPLTEKQAYNLSKNLLFTND